MAHRELVLQTCIAHAISEDEAESMIMIEDDVCEYRDEYQGEFNELYDKYFDIFFDMKEEN
jgi:hypothetical protein